MASLISTPPAHAVKLTETLITNGFAQLSPEAVAAWACCTLPELMALAHYWQDMPLDQHLKDAGKYRRRRHSCFVFEQGKLAQTAHRAHWQSLSYNALHGGMERWFEPINTAMLAQSSWQKLLIAFGQTAQALQHSKQASALPTQTQNRGCIEAHQFRIDTAGGIGRPTPEGAHRDGVDLVAVFMVNRHHIKGGETRVFDTQSTTGLRFTLTEPWSLVLLDDARVVHETTPIQPLSEALAHQGYRDTLVLTCKTDSFQEQVLATTTDIKNAS
jgi:hypothetical protein